MFLKNLRSNVIKTVNCDHFLQLTEAVLIQLQYNSQIFKNV